MPTILSLLVFDSRWRRWRLGAALAIYGAILLMGSVPGARAEIGLVASGIVLHSLAYGILAALLFGSTSATAAGAAVTAVLGVMAMGAGDELIQSMLPYRNGNPLDWLIDVGAATAVALVLWRVGARRLARA